MTTLIHSMALVLVISLSNTASAGTEPTPQELEDWFNAPPEHSANVNEGNLVFLSKPPDKPVHHHHNTLVITSQSIATGWADLAQCHENLDRVPSAQIVFRQGRIRNLTIVSYSSIKNVWVEGHTVQLRDIGPEAKLCLKGQSRVITPLGDGMFSIRNGPFMRKFLDGYFPMRVSMSITITAPDFHIVSITPPPQDGFQVKISPRQLDFEAWFEGALNTDIRIEKVKHMH